jgi:hypothetical protein
MYNQLIDYKIQQLSSEQLKQELLSFLDYLLIKQNVDEKPTKRIPKFGCAKGTFKMSDDFDEPLEDFKEYMP